MLGAPHLAEEAGSSGIGALGVDGISLLVYVVNFGILLLVLYLVAYKPILKMLDQRSRKIKESVEEAERVRQEAAQRQAEMQATLDQGRQESQRIFAEAREMAERFRQQEAERARRDAGLMVERAKVEIQRERDAAIEQVRQEFGVLAVTAAERVIHRSLDPQAHQDLINEVLLESESARGAGG
jgi:F-type H+-transporting ATPase subunit b